MKQENDNVRLNMKILMKKVFKDKIEWFVENYPEEISGWIIGTIGTEEIILEDLLIPYQEVSGASVDTSGGDLVRLRREYGDKCMKIIGHWHSHNTMSSFWSGTDEEFIKQHTEGRDMRIFVVSSTQSGHRIRLEIRKPLSFSIDELDYEVEKIESPLSRTLQKEIDKKVTKKTYPASMSISLDDVGYQGFGYMHNNQRELYGRDLNHLNDNIQGKESIYARVEEMIDYDRNLQMVTINQLDKDQVIELMREYSDLNPSVNSGFGEGNNTIVFSFAGKKVAKRFYREVKVKLINMLREELSNTQDIGEVSYDSYDSAY